MTSYSVTESDDDTALSRLKHRPRPRHRPQRPRARNDNTRMGEGANLGDAS